MLLRAAQGVKLFDDGRATVDGVPVRGASRIVGCAVGPRNCALLSEDGTVYCCIKAVARSLPLGIAACSVAVGSASLTVALVDGRVLTRAVKTCFTRVPLPHKAYRVFGGENTTAAICDTGSLYTWGKNRYQQLGHAAGPGPAAVAVPGTVADFGFGKGFGCALTAAGKLYTWGFGEVPLPVALEQRGTFSRIAVGKTYIAAAYSNRERVLLRGFISGAACYTVKTVSTPLSALSGGWSSTSLYGEFATGASMAPAGLPMLDLRGRRWLARRTLLQCIVHEQKKHPVRKRPRRRSEGSCANQLPLELWRMVVMYL